MIKQRELTVNQTLAEIKRLNEHLQRLQESLILRAQLQEVTELQYNALVQLAKEGIEFLQGCRAGDIVTAEWITRRNDLVERAQMLIQDAP
jgi:hypothetical protein